MFFAYPISWDGEFHAGMYRASLHANALWVGVGPEIVFWSVQRVGLERDALSVAHAHGLE